MNTAILRIFFISLMASVAWAVPGPPLLPTVQVYKSPTCGCCEAWVKHLRTNGFQVVAHDTNNVMAHKQRLGVPVTMGSCHTAEVGGYMVEGHVPAKDILRLLKQNPRARGLVVPGMPVGSPGMEGDHKDTFDVMLVKQDGSASRYARY